MLINKSLFTVSALFSALAAVATVAAPHAAAQVIRIPAALPPPPAAVPVEVVTHGLACARLTQTFVNEARAEGLSPVEQELFTGVGTLALVNALQSGELEGHLQSPLAAIEHRGEPGNPAAVDAAPRALPAAYIRLDQLTTSAHVAPKTNEPLYAPLVAFLAPMVGAAGTVAVAMSPDELRFMPYAQKGMSLVLVARSAAAIDAARARRVADVARALAVRVYLVWVGPETAPPTALMDLVASTGGAAAVIGADPRVCQAAL